MIKKKGRLNYKICDKWNPLIELEDSISKSKHYWVIKEFKEAIKYGHPLDQAISKNNPFVLEPIKQKFKIWDK